MSAWITDRLPTKSDADCVDEVTVTISGKVRTMNIRNVTEGLPWMRTPHPEPYVKPKVWDYSIQNQTVFIRKNGDVMGGLWLESGVTEDDVKAMTDALNRLEEGV